MDSAACKQEWEASAPTRVHRHVSDPGEGVKGEVLSRKYWKTGYALGSLGTDYL